MKILIIDDQSLFRAGLSLLLAQLLSAVEGGAQITQAESAQQAIDIIKSGNNFDLALLDWYMPGMEGMEALIELRNRMPSGRIIVMSGDLNPAVIQAAVDNGSAGYIPKDTPTDELTKALQLVAGGGVYFPVVALQESISDTVITGNVAQTIEASFPKLTARQCDVLKAMVKGLPNKSIARELNIAEDTVKQHLSAVYQCLNVQSRTQAVFLISRLGLLIA